MVKNANFEGYAEFESFAYIARRYNSTAESTSLLSSVASLAIITKHLSTGFVYKNIYCFIFMFPNNPQDLKPGRTLVFKEKDLTGLVSTPLFGFSVTIFLVKLGNKMFLKGKMIIYVNCSD